jgi:hypothetical protein
MYVSMSKLENRPLTKSLGPFFRRNGSYQPEKICKNYEKQNKFAGNSRK